MGLMNQILASPAAQAVLSGGTTDAPVGGAQDGPVAAQPAPRKQGGVLGALKSVLMPEAGSWLYAALNNDNGIWGARGAQQDYTQQQQAKTLAMANEQAKLDKAKRAGEFQVVGNNVFHTKPDGTFEMITPPAAPTETQRLIDQWKATPPGPERDLIERAIKGYQYTPPVIAAQTNAKMKLQSAGIAQRGAEARKTKTTPGASAAKPAGQKLPTGFILNP